MDSIKLMIALGVLVTLILTHGYVAYRYYHYATDKVKVNQMTSEIKGRDKQDASDKDVMQLRDNDLDAAVNHWLYD